MLQLICYNQEKSVKPIHEMYLNALYGSIGEAGWFVKPIHEMYLNWLNILQRVLPKEVKPIHEMYLNGLTAPSPAF